MVDRRRIARTRISALVLVMAEGGSLVWRYLVRDITSLGARIEFPDAPVLRTEFNLTFDGKTLRRCRLKWRIANEVGVCFSTPDQDPTQRMISHPPDTPLLVLRLQLCLVGGNERIRSLTSPALAWRHSAEANKP
jgi:hypothetical protein